LNDFWVLNEQEQEKDRDSNRYRCDSGDSNHCGDDALCRRNVLNGFPQSNGSALCGSIPH